MREEPFAVDPQLRVPLARGLQRGVRARGEHDAHALDHGAVLCAAMASASARSALGAPSRSPPPGPPSPFAPGAEAQDVQGGPAHGVRGVRVGAADPQHQLEHRRPRLLGHDGERRAADGERAALEVETVQVRALADERLEDGAAAGARRVRQQVASPPSATSWRSSRAPSAPRAQTPRPARGSCA